MADRMTLVLIAGYIGALALGAYELQRAPSVPVADPGQAVQPLPPLDVPPRVIKSIAAYDAITERPLFSRERLPESDTQKTVDKQPSAAPEEIKGIRLAAVLKGADSVTVLFEDQSGTTRILHQGDQIGNWRLEEILDDRVVMVSDSRKETLMVHRFDPAAAKRTPRRRPTTAGPRTTQRPSQPVTPRSIAIDRRPGGIAEKP